MRGKSCDLHHIPTDLTPASPEAPDMVHDVDQEENLYATKITNLPLKLAQPICEYLGAVDIVNVCSIIPSWQWILPLQTPYSFSNKWKWVDKQFCTTLHSSSYTTDFTKFRQATKQHFEQMKFDLQLSSIRAPRGTFERVNCLLVKPLRPFPSRSRDVAEWVRLSQSPNALSMKVMNSNRPTTVKIDKIHSRTFLVGTSIIGHNGLPCTVVGECEKCQTERKRALAVYDCVLLVIRLSVLSEFSITIGTMLQAIVPNLSPDQTLGVVIMEDVSCKEQVGMGFFMDCLRKLGSVNDSTLMAAPMNWRMWCIQLNESCITDRSDILEWVCRDVIWKRIQTSEFHLAAKPSEALDFPDWYT